MAFIHGILVVNCVYSVKLRIPNHMNREICNVYFLNDENYTKLINFFFLMLNIFHNSFNIVNLLFIIHNINIHYLV